ncbi:UNVERIFIED_CONTAM: hypothetical protein GTU68_018078 [Idotea baltica]|nr:hypothetical protein [Idotea baltica]
MNRKITIGSRGSKLALWQAHYVENLLEEKGFEVEIQIIKTQGDKIQNVSFDKLEGKGFFTKELEDSLLNESIDLAVHSFKDLPTENPPGLEIAGSSYRDKPEDWLIINKNAVDVSQLWNLKRNATIGTSSPRRVAQLLAFRPDLKIIPIRGNVPTRVAKVDEEVDAVVLAAAGLRRLNLDLSNYEVHEFDCRKFIPAPVQGVLAYQIKTGNQRAKEAVAVLHNRAVAKTVKVERTILNGLEGGCQLPIGVYCILEEGVYKVWAFYQAIFNVEKPKPAPSKRIFRSSTNPETLAEEVFKELKIENPKKVFISRGQSSNSFFTKHLVNRGFSVEGQSLISFKTIMVERIPKADWIFFSSRKGVEYFFTLAQQLNVVQKLLIYKIACMGSGTADELRKFGFTPDFVGNDEGIDSVATDFLEVATGQKVLFPQAQTSKQTVQKFMDNTVNIMNWVIYENAPVEDLPELNHEILAFTSSMNAEAYFSKYKLKPNQRVIAIGSSTAETLQNLGVENFDIAWQASEMGIIDVI